MLILQQVTPPQPQSVPTWPIRPLWPVNRRPVHRRATLGVTLCFPLTSIFGPDFSHASIHIGIKEQRPPDRGRSNWKGWGGGGRRRKRRERGWIGVSRSQATSILVEQNDKTRRIKPRHVDQHRVNHCEVNLHSALSYHLRLFTTDGVKKRWHECELPRFMGNFLPLFVT